MENVEGEHRSESLKGQGDTRAHVRARGMKELGTKSALGSPEKDQIRLASGTRHRSPHKKNQPEKDFQLIPSRKSLGKNKVQWVLKKLSAVIENH